MISRHPRLRRERVFPHVITGGLALEVQLRLSFGCTPARLGRSRLVLAEYL